LDFLRQALRQRESRGLAVEDGWLYFLYGWTEVISQVLHVKIGKETFDRLARVAAEICTPALPPRSFGQPLRAGLMEESAVAPRQE
jgi:hypothetical protein